MCLESTWLSMNEKVKLNVLPSISVIIPSVLRPSLLRAIASVRRQSYEGVVECIVVIDLPEITHSLPPEVLATADLVVWTGGRARGGGARNLGIELSTGDLVALLDDDDEWMPGKLASQVNLARQLSSEFVISCRLVHRQSNSDAVSGPVPEILIGQQRKESVEEYLFVRRMPSVARASLYTSTLLVSGNLARAVPWNPSLSRHQDWDWLMRLQCAGAIFASTKSAAAVIWLQSEGSISSSADWRSSLEWIESWDTHVSRAVTADFLAGQPLRYALQARSLRGIVAVLRAIVKTRHMPHYGPIIIGLLGLVPRRVLAKLMTSSSVKKVKSS